MWNSTSERRLRRYYINPDCIMTYLQSMKRWPDCFGRAILEGLPDDAALSGVRWDDERRCLVAYVFHESFSVVPDGEIIPEGEPGYRAIRMAWFVRQSDGSYRSTDDKQQAFGDLRKQADDRCEMMNVAGHPLPSKVVESETGTNYQNVDMQAEFFKRSILAE